MNSWAAKVLTLFPDMFPGPLGYSLAGKALMDELGFMYTYTPVYAPEYNGIEEVFSMAKQIIKKKRLDNMLGNDEEDLVRIIYNAFHSIDPHHIAKCISRSLALLNLNAF